jgi:phosphatidylglycerol lysyltransferase
LAAEHAKVANNGGRTLPSHGVDKETDVSDSTRGAREDAGNGTRDDARAMALLTRYARNAMAFRVLSPGMRHWFAAHRDPPHIATSNDHTATNKPRAGDDNGDDGLVAYVEVAGAWVTAGEPIASSEHTIEVAERFVEHAIRHHKRVSFFATEGALALSPRFRRVLIGEQAVWNPQEWAEVVKANRSLREQLRRARAKGVRIRALSADDVREGTPMRAALDRLIQRWLATRPMSSLHFLVMLDPFGFVGYRRLFVAERIPADASHHEDDPKNATRREHLPSPPLAFLSLAPVAARNGWLLEHLLRDPDAINGTSEALVDFAMRTMASEGVTWATLGLAPLTGPVSGWLRIARIVARPFYNFAGLSAFKRKLRPGSWEPIYLAYPRESSSVWAMRDGLRAFAGGSLIAFGARTVLRGPIPMLRALELSLIPWTIALALWPLQPWFPHSSLKWAWVVFDVLLLAALQRLRKHWSDELARSIAIVVTMDAILTLTQMVLWNASRTRSALDVLMVVVACGGPTLSAAVLWGAVRRRRVVAG